MNADDVFAREALKIKEAECERLAEQVRHQATEIESLRAQLADADRVSALAKAEAEILRAAIKGRVPRKYVPEVDDEEGA